MRVDVQKLDGDTPSYDVDLYDDDVIANQQAHFRKMRELGPVIWLPHHGNYAVTRYAELSDALRNWEVFSSASGVAGDEFGCQFSRGGTLTSDPPLHDKLRKVSGAPLRPARLDAYRGDIQAEAAELIDRLIQRGDFDGILDFARHLPLTMVTEFVGLPEEGRENMLSWAAAGFDVLGCQNARGQKGLETVKGMRDWIIKNVRPETMKPGSWSAELAELAANGDIPQEYVPLIMRDYLGPSLDTTISATGQLIYQLGRNRDQWNLLRENPSLIPTAVSEAVRLASPVRSFTRTTTQDIELCGVSIPKGARVMMLYASANRDERQFENPDAFDVTRTNTGHLGFGQGIHICAGQHLAQLEMQSLLKAMISRVETISVGEPTLALNNTIFGFATLPVRFTALEKTTKITRPAAILDGWIDVRVARRSDVATDIVSLEFEAEDGGVLPAYAAGSHIDLKLGNGLVRQYSLCSSPKQNGCYRIAVLREVTSRGGSAFVHDSLQIGSRLQISAPRNLFPLQADTAKPILIAGGIGVTPILSMAYALHGEGHDFEMHYTGRETSRLAFASEIAAAFGTKQAMYADDAIVLPQFDLTALLSKSDPAQPIYCCGPGGFIDFVVRTAKEAGWPDNHIHFERFSGDAVQSEGAFQVVAQKSGITIDVADGTTLLQAVLDAGIDHPYSCETGICGTCVCNVVDGEPDHRDAFFTEEQRAANNKMILCCSRAKSDTLILDI